MDIAYLAEYAVRAKGSTSCPNCGAAIESDKCSYCGAVFVDFAAMDTEKPFFMKVKHKDEIRIFKVMMQSISLETNYDETVLYSDNRPTITLRSPDTTIETTFKVLDI